MVTLQHLNFITEGALVIWEWDWLDWTSPSLHATTPPDKPQHVVDDQEVDSATTDPAQVIQHTVRFKCIGVTKRTIISGDTSTSGPATQKCFGCGG